jgi:hypothetical protein
MSASEKQVYPLLGLLTTDLPGCGTADKLAALERAASDFCERSRCWREQLTVELVAGAYEASLLWPCDGYAIGTTLVSIDGAAVRGAGGYLLVPARIADGMQGILFPTRPACAQGCTLVLFGTLIPRRGSLELPDWILDNHGAAIADGAAAMLKRHGRKAYSDLPGSAEYMRTFERGVAAAAIDGAARQRGVS